MAWRLGRLALFPWMCTSLFAGCMHHHIHDSASLCTVESVEKVTKDSAEAATARPGSPYRVFPAATAETVTTAERIHLPDAPVAAPATDKDVTAEAPNEQSIEPDKQATSKAPAEASPGYLPPSAAIGAPTDIERNKPPSIEASPAAATVSQEEPDLIAALRCCLDKRPADAVNRLGRYDKTNQELLLCVLSMAARLTEGKLQPQDLAVMLEELNSMMVPLKSQAALAIEKICFCQRIDTFGIYEPLPADHRFRPGDLVHIYAEVRNFSSRKLELPSGQVSHVVELASSAEIEDYAGNKVYPTPIAFHRKKPDESRTLRQDYFDNYHFVVPDLPPGAYKLWIQVEDVGTRPSRKARRSLDFYVTNLSARRS